MLGWLSWRGPRQVETKSAEWWVWETEGGEYRIVRSLSTVGGDSYFSACAGRSPIGGDVQTLKAALGECVGHRLLVAPGLGWTNNDRLLAHASREGLSGTGGPGVGKSGRPMVLEAHRVRAMLAEAGVCCERWDLSKLQAYVGKLSSNVAPSSVTGENRRLYRAINRGSDRPLLLEESESPAVSPGPEPKPAPRPEAYVKPKKPQKPPAPPAERKGNKDEGRGLVCRTVLSLLEGGSERHPVTLDFVLQRMAKKFPGRDHKGLESTVKRAPYWAPQLFDVTMHKSAKGYWLTRDYQGEFKRIANTNGKKQG